MMSTFAPYKVVSALPSPLVANAMYAVRVGTGFDLYIVDSSGANAFKVNGGDSGMSYLTTIYGDAEAYAFVLNTQGLTTAQLNTWLNSQTRIDQFTTLLNSHVTLPLMFNDSALWGAVAASSTAMTAVAASSTAMTAVINSTTAMTAVAASSTAMTAVINSTITLNAVVASSTAMAAVAASSAAMAVVVASSTAMTAVAASSTAMTAVAASSTAMTAVIASSTAMTAVAASSTAMTAVASSSTAMTAVAASSTAMTAVASSSTAMTAVINSTTAMTAVAASSTAMTAVENNATAYSILHASASAMEIVAVSTTAMGVIAASATYLANLFTSQVARRSLVTGITDWGTNAALDAIRNSTTAMTWLRANKVVQFDLVNNDVVQNVYNGNSIAIEYWSTSNYGNQGVPSGFYVGGVAKQTRANSDSTPDVAVKGAVGQLQCKDGYYYTYCKYIILD